MFPPEFIIGVGVVAALAVYVLFGSEIKPTLHLNRQTGSFIPSAGLVNLGQTCFFNAVLQAMASCHSFCYWIDPNFSNNPTVRCTNTNLLNLLHQIIGELRGNRGNNQVADSRILCRLLQEIREEGWVVENSEHDAHELFQALMNLLHSQPTYSVEGGIRSLSTPAEEISDSSSQCHQSVTHRSRAEQTKLLTCKSPLLGYTASSMRCKTCFRGSPTKYTEFTSLSLTFPPTTPRAMYSLDDLLKYYFLSDTLSDVDCEDCSRRCEAPVKSDFLREQSLGKLPQCLCLHIQRLGWYGYHEALKRHDKVAFPASLNMTEFTQLHKVLSSSSLKRGFMRLSGLSSSRLNQLEAAAASNKFDILDSSNPQTVLSEGTPDGIDQSHNTSSQSTVQDTPLTGVLRSSQNSRCWYNLVSVIEHSGTEVSGHFTTYRRVDNSQGRWIYTSDLDVREVSAEYVHSRVPYMLFYERVAQQQC